MSWQSGGGLVQILMQQFPCSCSPVGHVPESGIGSHAGCPPHAHSCTQYCVAAHVEVPHAKGPSAGGNAPSVAASAPFPPPAGCLLLELHAAIPATTSETTTQRLRAYS